MSLIQPLHCSRIYLSLLLIEEVKSKMKELQGLNKREASLSIVALNID